jgi:hypothetical protein
VGELQRCRHGDVTPDAGPWVRELIDQLALLGLVHERDDGSAAVEREAALIRDAIGECRRWLAGASAGGQVAAAARRLRDEGLAPSLQIDEPLPWVSDGRGGANVPLTALALALRYQRASARLSYAAVRWLLSEAIGEDPVPWAGVVESRCGTDEDPGYAVAAVNATAALLVLATRPDATQWLTPPRSPAASRLSGLAHAARLEEALVSATAGLGPDALGDVAERPPSLLSAMTIERCLLARRTVDSVLPALTARLRAPIRRELLALEAVERDRLLLDEATCRAEGVDPHRLDTHLALPWFQVLIDALLAVAQADTGAFLAAVLLTDGRPGDPFGLRRRLGPAGTNPGDPPGDTADDAVARRARVMLGQVPSVTAFRHRRVVESVVLLAEMAERGWRLLVDVHTDHRAGRWLPPAYHRRSLRGAPGAGHP